MKKDGIWRLVKMQDEHLVGWYLVRFDENKSIWVYRKCG